MTVKKLMDILREQPEDANVYVSCQGWNNHDPETHSGYYDSEDTYVLKHNGELYIADGCRIED